jgi:DNA ligase-associated metallophosphoesterase
MKLKELEITARGESLFLTNQRAAFWPEKRTLIVSDIHLGKPAHFRRNGIAIPGNITVRDLERLEQLLIHYRATQLIVAGDLIHAEANSEVLLLAALLESHPALRVILIKGNHDRLSDKNIKALGIHEVHRELVIGPFVFSHKNEASSKKMLISGHIHPGVALTFPAGKTVKLPCFVVSETEIILPAFSLFTGLDTKSIPQNAVCYAFYEDGIFKI